MVMWHTSLSPYIKVLPTTSPSFVSVLLTPPGILPSLHTSVYLPTAGKDGEWLATLVQLEAHVMENIVKYGKLATFLRGDFNASSKNKPRSAILSSVIARLSLNRVNIDHYSYHHFRGDGDSDSDLDLLLYGGGDGVAEHLDHIECKFVNPLLFSHHDLIVSECSIPPLEIRSTDESKNITAPEN